MAAKKLSVEDSMKRLDEITAEMEKSDVTLEESFKLFNEGMTLVKNTKKDLTDLEKQIKVLSEDSSKETDDE
ncbi:MAG: exodeoxyribonuclease VII small subunit [Catonella sp.]|jgi:exodeoxyribonuclease VII small subunit|nr:exodeoxyribonuclease VII small subunit [Catonella sp.]MDY6355692.1 exodeoxyribonuclease VII small subunit [Catonella sp.]